LGAWARRGRRRAAAIRKNVWRHARDRLTLLRSPGPVPEPAPEPGFCFPAPAPGPPGGTMDVGRVKVEVWGDRRLGLARPAGGAGD